MNSKTVTAEVYHFEDVGGGLWIWDFGFTNLVGDKNYPTKNVESMPVFSFISNGTDVNTFRNDKTPEKTVNLTVYLGDYVCYIPSTQEDSTYAMSPDDKPYYIVDTATRQDEKLVILEKDDRQRNESIAIEKENFESKWTPVNRF